MSDLSSLRLIPIGDYMSVRGFNVVSKTSGKLWYKATWDRSDSTPSVCVDVYKNKFLDFGNGRTGSIIDLVMYIDSCDVGTAINKLKSCNLSGSTQVTEEVKQDGFIVTKVQPVSSWFLVDYILNKRKIPLKFVHAYCKEIHFLSKNKSKFYGLGFQTDAGGWEIRNSIAKTSISPKTPTTINAGSKNVSVFEGFIDFLSACAYYDKHPTNTVVVLNSVANVAKVDWTQYDKAYLFLDNDRSGSFTTGIISDALPSVDMRYIFDGYDDFNDFIIKTK